MKNNVYTSAILNVFAVALVSACAGGGSSSDEARSTYQTTPASSNVAPIEMPRFAEAKSCVYEKTINGRKFMEQRSFASSANNLLVWNVKKDGTVRGTIELDAKTADVVKDYALANDQRISFSPPYKWADFPISVGKTWESQSTVTGETFVSDINVKFAALSSERVKVPAGEFDAIKVVAKERIRSGSTSGSGTLTYWITSSGPCSVVKITYTNTYSEKGQALLVASE